MQSANTLKTSNWCPSELFGTASSRPPSSHHHTEPSKLKKKKN